MSRVTPLAVAERELLRLGRRWQTMAVRTVFGLVLFLIVGSVYAVQSELAGAMDVTQLHEIGRNLFVTWAGLMFAAVIAVTPLMVGQAIIDEKDEQTLELLAITRLTARQILWGKLISRLIGVEAMMIAGLPVLAVVLGFGGVAPMEMFGAFLLSNVTLLVAGAVATFCALYARSPVIVALQTWGWLWVGWLFVGPMVGGAAFVGASAGMLSTNPGMAMGGLMSGQAGVGVLHVVAPVIVWTIVSFAVMHVAAVCFETLALGNADPDSADADLSAGFWKLDKLVKWLWPIAILCFLTTPMVMARGIVAQWIPVLPDLIAYAWLTVTFSVGGVGYLMLIRRRTLKQNAKKKKQGAGRRVGWQRLARHYDEVPATESGAWQAVHGAGEGREHHVQDALAGKRKRRRRLSPFNRQVWDDPVAWRESVTAAHGSLRRGLAGFYIVTGILFALVLLAGGFTDDGVSMAFGITLLMIAPPILLLLATSSIVGERRAGSLELLCATKLTAAKIIRGKLFGVAYYIGPAMALGSLLVLAGSADMGSRDGAVIAFTGLTWYGVMMLMLAVFAMWRALAVKAPAQAWAANILTPLALTWLVGAVTAFIVEEAESLAWTWGLVVPFSILEIDDDLLATYLLASSGFWALVTLVLFWRTAALLRRHAAAM